MSLIEKPSNFMAVAEPPSKDISAVALPGLARALVTAGKLGQKAAEDIYRKALTGKTKEI